MRRRALGSQGLEVSAIGLGCMGMSQWYGERDDAGAARALLAALDVGIDLFDTSDAYGPHTNEELLGSVLGARWGDVVLATKVGIIWEDGQRRLDGRPLHIAGAARASLRRLKADHIDLYYLHRVDPAVPIEDSIGAMSDLVDEGLVRFIGLSEASPSLIERAHRVHPLSAVESEYSLWSREPEDDVLASTASLGIGFVPYSPLGRGLSSGQIRSIDDLAPDDARRTRFPRFSEDNIDRNVALVDELERLASTLELTPAQLSLAWVLAQGEHIVPIPGTKRERYVRENAAAAAVALDDAVVAELSALFGPDAVAGERKDGSGMEAMRGGLAGR